MTPSELAQEPRVREAIRSATGHSHTDSSWDAVVAVIIAVYRESLVTSEVMKEAAKAFESSEMCEPCNTETPSSMAPPTVCFCMHLGLQAAAPILVSPYLQEIERLQARVKELEKQVRGLKWANRSMEAELNGEENP